MVKFGKSLEVDKVSKWSDGYVNYDTLKATLSEMLQTGAPRRSSWTARNSLGQPDDPERACTEPPGLGLACGAGGRPALRSAAAPGVRAPVFDPDCDSVPTTPASTLAGTIREFNEDILYLAHSLATTDEVIRPPGAREGDFIRQVDAEIEKVNKWTKRIQLELGAKVRGGFFSFWGRGGSGVGSGVCQELLLLLVGSGRGRGGEGETLAGGHQFAPAAPAHDVSPPQQPAYRRPRCRRRGERANSEHPAPVASSPQQIARLVIR